MDVEVISTEIVKPSRPTPKRHGFLNLSLFHHVDVPILMPMIFFYPSKSQNENNGTTNEVLKESLAETLTEFYPLAGRLAGCQARVVCNDEGVPYVRARIMSRLSDIIYKVEPAELDELLLPCHQVGPQGFTDLVLAIQVNLFSCGGVAIGVRINTKVSDAYSMLMFVKAWAAMATFSHVFGGGNNHGYANPRPCFDISRLFPPLPLNTRVQNSGISITSEPVTKRFTFNVANLAALKSKYCSSVDDCSTGMVLSAFLWSCLRKYTNQNRNYEVFHLVNLRPKIPLPQQEFYFGKMAVRATTKIRSSSNITTLIDRMRSSVEMVEEGLLKTKGGGDEFVRNHLNQVENAKRGDINILGFSSLRSLPVYEADFGWGKPIWVTCPSIPSKNLILFFPSLSKRDIEVCISLSKEDMIKLENDHDFISFVSAPPPLACKL